MPFKSESQRRKFAELLKQGKISQETFDKWDKETTDKKLPDRNPSYSPKIRRPQYIRGPK